MKMQYHGQVLQDKFVANIMDFKKNGFFLEIGSNEPINGNNSYSLESQLNWTGVMVELSDGWINQYKEFRPASTHVIGDAQIQDYFSILKAIAAPKNIDYLQIDLDEENGSTLNTLKKLQSEVFSTYKFATVTFEHDIYRSNVYDTRMKSREIMKGSGYVDVFTDVFVIGPNAFGNMIAKPFEDWYVHPDLVDMDYVHKVQQANERNYIFNSLTEKSIHGRDVIYPVR